MKKHRVDSSSMNMKKMAHKTRICAHILHPFVEMVSEKNIHLLFLPVSVHGTDVLKKSHKSASVGIESIYISSGVFGALTSLFYLARLTS